MAVTTSARAIEPPGSMGFYQWLIVALCCVSNLADGYDVVSLAVAAPVLSKQWHVDPAIMGLLFSAVAVGLVVGAFVIAPMADKVGRRPIMLGSLGSLAVALFLSGVSGNIWQLLALRFVTGIGLGTLVVCLNTTAAEYASDARRNIAMATVHIGFTLGMIVGSGVAAYVLKGGGWRPIFFVGGALNTATFLASVVLLGESREFLARRQGAGDLARLNRMHRRMGIAELASVPSLAADKPALRQAWNAILAPSIRSQTVLIWIASVTYAIVGYFLLNWKPTILANAGLSPSLAAASGIITGASGAFGHLTMGLLARRVGEGRLTAIYYALAAVTLVIFGVQPPDAIPLLVMAGVVTFFVVGAYTGLFLVSVVMYPPQFQNAGVGFIVGFGRIGAIVGPLIGGFLLSAGLTRMDTYFVFSAIALVPWITMMMANRLARTARQGDYTVLETFDVEPAI